mgnify:CR=1 FL=1
MRISADFFLVKLPKWIDTDFIRAKFMLSWRY